MRYVQTAAFGGSVSVIISLGIRRKAMYVRMYVLSSFLKDFYKENYRIISKGWIYRGALTVESNVSSNLNGCYP